MAFDPSAGKFYWSNSGNATNPVNAIGTLTLGGVGGGITPQTAEVNYPQDPLILSNYPKTPVHGRRRRTKRG